MDRAAPEAASTDLCGPAENVKADGPWDTPPYPPGLLLASLRWNWDSVYLIVETDDGRLLITRADGRGSFHARDALDARDAIVGDHARMPVTQPLETGALGRRLAFESAHRT